MARSKKKQADHPSSPPVAAPSGPGPHCGRIELAQFPKRRDEKLILRDMGRETANLHLATADQRKSVLGDLAERGPDWLLAAARAMAKATERDWQTFRAPPLAVRT